MITPVIIILTLPINSKELISKIVAIAANMLSMMTEQLKAVF